MTALCPNNSSTRSKAFRTLPNMMSQPAHDSDDDESKSIALSSMTKSPNFDLYNPTVEGFTDRVNKGMLELDVPDHMGLTQLHIAAKRNSVDIAEYILTQKVQKINIDARNNAKQTPLHLAHSPEMVLLLISHGASLVIRDINQTRSIDACLEQVKLPAEFFFHKGIQESIKVTSLLPFLRSPIKELNKIFLENPKTGESIIGNLFLKYLMADDRNSLLYMIQFHYFLQRAHDIKWAEQNDLQDLLTRVENMITEVFSCDSLDSPINVQRLLQPETNLTCYSMMKKKIQRHSVRPIATNSALPNLETDSVVGDSSTSRSSHLTKQHELEKQNEHLLQLIEANSFKETGILQFCRLHSIKMIFDKPQVSSFVDALFTSYLQDLSHDKSPAEQKLLIERIIGFWYYKNINKKAHSYLVRSLTLRSCPAVLFVSEFLSKIASLFLVALVSIELYAKKFGTNYDDDSTPSHFYGSEAFLAIFTVAHFLSEIAQLSECHWNLKIYASDEWNIADVIDVALTFAWLILRIMSQDNDSNYFHVARIVLGLVSIPKAIGLLRFLSIYKPLGELVIMLTAMFKELLMFALIFMICTIGFGISFYGLFYNNQAFSSIPTTALTLFQYTLSNFDFSAFDVETQEGGGDEYNSIAVNNIGILILVVYLIIVTIVLVNLLIARMTNSYEKVNAQSLAEWSFNKAEIMNQFLLLHEHHPFGMLPVPLNMITTALYPIHYYYLPTGISICGTVCNIVYAYLGGIIRIFIILFSFIADFANGIFQVVWRRRKPEFRASSILSVLLMPLTVVYTTWITPLVLWKDMIARVHPKEGTLLFLYNAINRHDSRSGHVHDDEDDQNKAGGSNPMQSVDNDVPSVAGMSSLSFAMDDEMKERLFTEQDSYRIVQWLRLENDPATANEVRDLKMEVEKLQELIKKALKTE